MHVDTTSPTLNPTLEWREKQKSKIPQETLSRWSEGIAHAAIASAALLPLVAQKIGPLPTTIMGSIAAGTLLFVAKSSEEEAARASRWFSLALLAGSLSAQALAHLEFSQQDSDALQRTCAAKVAQARLDEALWQ